LFEANRNFDWSSQISKSVKKAKKLLYWIKNTIVYKHTHLKEKLDKAAIRVLAFDIETTK